MFGQMDLVLIGGAVLLLFGPSKLPELMRGMGKGVREFKKAQSEFEGEIKNAIEPPEKKTTQNKQEV
ncbi:MAG: twin-arginine translocase TatA/TatE family subunit [Chlorobium sp.]|nr:MAG: twin-arginine translocase TatA/TatE family subunit [Chlorobium sp.]